MSLPDLATLRRLLSSKLGWTTGSFAVVQGIRLVNNVLLARIVLPELLGIMLIVNTIRTGIELLSDIGIGQNIVSSKEGEDPDFLDTAWTVQIIRALILCIVALGLAYPASLFYEDDVFLTIIPIMSLAILILGFQSTGRFLLQKRMDVKRFGIFEMTLALVSSVVGLVMVWYRPTVATMAWSLVIATLLGTIGTYFLVPDIRHRWRLSEQHIWKIVHFGKWVFLSSILFFLAMNFDRLYLGKHITLTLLGVYGVARSLSDVASLMALRIGSLVIFPKVAAIQNAGLAPRPAMAAWRWRLMLLAAVAMGLFLAVSDQIVFLLYDHRYDGAAFLLPILGLGVWFSVLGIVADAAMVGLGKPAHTARANGVKFAWLLIGLPLVVPTWGVAGAAGIIATAELARYLPLSLSQRQEKFSFFRQDFVTTLIVIATALATRTLLDWVGMTEGVGAWWQLRTLVGL